jgi:hypothetical protein
MSGPRIEARTGKEGAERGAKSEAVTAVLSKQKVYQFRRMDCRRAGIHLGWSIEREMGFEPSISLLTRQGVYPYALGRQSIARNFGHDLPP